MTVDDAFLTEVLARPEADEPRLVYADWLQPQNEVRTTFFIRQQCKLSRLSVADPERIRLRLKTQPLAAQFERQWAAAIYRTVLAMEFRRGFVERVTVDAETFLNQHQKLFAAAPLRSVCFADAAGHLAEIVRCPGLHQLTELGFVGEAVPNLEQVLQHPGLQRVESLRFGAGSFSAETLDAFADLPRERSLKRLDIRQSLLSAPAIGELLGFPVFGQLEELLIGPIPMLERRYQIALELSPILNRLQRLDLAMCGLSAPDLSELFHLCTSRTISDLRLPRNPLGWQGVRSLLEAPFAARLTTLDLSSCQLNSKAMSLLGRLPLDRLRRLNLNHNLLDHRCAKELAASANLVGVIDLRLQGTQGRLRQGSFQLGDVGLAALLSEGLHEWRSLDLARNNLTAKGLSRLLDTEGVEQLMALDLSHNPLDDRAAATLLERGPWPDLVSLRLTNSEFSNEQRARLKAAFGGRCSL